MNYEGLFLKHLNTLREEGRYRVFADLERHVGSFPRATRYNAGGQSDVTVCAPTTISAWASTRR
jgi:5-aminolevulinate synthase